MCSKRISGQRVQSPTSIPQVELTSDLDARLANPVHRLTEQDSFDVTVTRLGFSLLMQMESRSALETLLSCLVLLIRAPSHRRLHQLANCHHYYMLEAV